MPRQLRHPTSHVQIRPAGLADRPDPRQPEQQIQHISRRVHRRHHTSAPSQRDLTQTELLNPRRPLTTQRHQHIPRTGRFAGVDRGPLRQHLQIPHLSQPTSPHRTRRLSQQAIRIEIGQVVVHDPKLGVTTDSPGHLCTIGHSQCPNMAHPTLGSARPVAHRGSRGTIGRPWLDGREQAPRRDAETSPPSARTPDGRSATQDGPATSRRPPAGRFTAPGLAHLQRLAGNRAVARTLGRRGPPAAGVGPSADPGQVLDQSVIRGELAACRVGAQRRRRARSGRTAHADAAGGAAPSASTTPPT